MADEFHLGSGNWWDSTRNRSSIDSGTVSGGSTVLHDQSSNPNLQMMGLGLSSQPMDWNQAMFRGEKSESSFRNMLQDNTANDFKEINRGFCLDQFSSQASSNESTITSPNLNTGYHVDSGAAYGLLMSENQPDQQPSYENRSINYASGYGELMQSWNKFSQAASGSHLHFTNNTPFWNASATVNDARPGFFPALPSQIPLAPSFDQKPKNTLETGDLGTTTKKNYMESSSNKRPRNEMASPLPACNNKVKKEKMGDRITALQQLVSPFGKTDTASVLSEAIECIKFLHEQVTVFSTPYMKNVAPVQHQQNSEKSKDQEGARQDLRSRGLCLVPVSSTFPMTQETTVEVWTPTFGGTFR